MPLARTAGLFVVLASMSACARPASHAPVVLAEPQVAAREPRFLRVDEIVVLPESGDAPVPLRTGYSPRYPRSARIERRNDRLVMAFVIDTTGRVELPTVSVVAPPEDRAFTGSVCLFLAQVRYATTSPPRRVLLLQPFYFQIAPSLSEVPSRAPADESLKARLKAMPRAELIAWLETLGHCD